MIYYLKTVEYVKGSRNMEVIVILISRNQVNEKEKYVLADIIIIVGVVVVVVVVVQWNSKKSKWRITIK